LNSHDEKYALVTGSSRGIGRGIALALARAGINVAVNYLSDAKAAINMVGEIVRLGKQSFSIQADVRDFDSVKNLIWQAEQKFGRIDVLVNNVGDFIQKPLAQTSVKDWHSMLDSNLNSAFYCCKVALEGMRRRGYGRIINITVANAARRQAYKQVAAYTIAKTGVLILTKSLAVEEAKNGITVNAISPGFIDTGSITLKLKEETKNKIPMRKLGSPQDIANAVLFLISDEAEYITGAEIVVSGGWGLL